MAIIYSVNMNKGGAGKTSLITNLASALNVTKPESKILIIDTDGQGNAGMAYSLKPHELENTIYDVFIGDLELKDVIINIGENIDLVAANDDMNYIEFDVLTKMNEFPNPLMLLKKAIDPMKELYDYIFIDAPPSLGLVSGNILNITDKVLIPFVPELFGVQGLVRVIESVNEFKHANNPNLEIAGIVGMMVDQRTTLHSEMLQEARKYCLEKNIKLFDTVIPRSIRFANATAYDGKPAVLNERSNKIVSAYYELLEEVLEHGSKW